MEIETLRALLLPAGRRLLERAGRLYAEASAGGRPDPLVIADRLRREVDEAATAPAGPEDGEDAAEWADPALISAALTQAALRIKAADKFGPDAASMLFTRDGLEQATAAPVAEHRAARFAARLPGSDLVDLGCGLGGDLIALARAGLTVTGVDSDPLTAELARTNLAALGLSGAKVRVVVDEAESYRRAAPPDVAVFADPARRTARGRVFDPDAYSPSWSFVRELLDGDAGVKTAPIIPHRLIPENVEAEWVSLGGEVREAALWSGRLRSDATRRATVLARTGAQAATTATLTDDDDPGEAPVEPPSGILYEPDGAVIRAGLVTALVPILDAALVHPQIAYLTSQEARPTRFAAAYEILEVHPYDLRRLRRRLAELNVGTLTIKRRGLDLDPEQARKRLAGRGPERATVIFTRTPDGARALLVAPVDRR